MRVCQRSYAIAEGAYSALKRDGPPRPLSPRALPLPVHAARAVCCGCCVAGTSPTPRTYYYYDSTSPAADARTITIIVLPCCWGGAIPDQGGSSSHTLCACVRARGTHRARPGHPDLRRERCRQDRAPPGLLRVFALKTPCSPKRPGRSVGWRAPRVVPPAAEMHLAYHAHAHAVIRDVHQIAFPLRGGKEVV